MTDRAPRPLPPFRAFQFGHEGFCVDSFVEEMKQSADARALSKRAGWAARLFPAWRKGES